MQPLAPCSPTPPARLQVLYLGGASGTSVSHVSDIVGPEGSVYAVEFSHRRRVWEGWVGVGGHGRVRGCEGARAVPAAQPRSA